MGTVVIYAYLLLLAWQQVSVVISANGKTTSTSAPKNTMVSATPTSVSPAGKTIVSSSPINQKVDLAEEVNSLLKELKEIVGTVKDARDEQQRLAHSVAQISATVRDMSELNIHLKKKVRKMSKLLSRNPQTNKLQNGIRNLQKDHDLILRAMNLTRTTHKHRDGNRDNVTKSKVLTESPPIPDLVVDPAPEGEEEVSQLPLDCREVMQKGNWSSGVYLIQPRGLLPMKVWCDQLTSGGGWTVVVSRQTQEPQEDFIQNWEKYKSGFGNPAGEHWIGNAALHAMTHARTHELRVNISDWNESSVWGIWKEFKVDSESNEYKLHVNRYTSASTAGDAMKWHNQMKFSTPDRDNDQLLAGHCARNNNAGWWYRGYRGCYQAHPTGLYQRSPAKPPPNTDTRLVDLGPVMVWQNWRGESFYPKTLFIMVRPSIP